MKINSSRLSLVQLIYCTYFKCSRAMEEVIKGRWILFCGLLNFMVPVLFYAVSFRANMSFIGRTQGITDVALCRDAAFVQIGSSGVQNAVLWLLRSVLLFLLLKLMRTEGTFKQVLSICGIAYLAVVPMMLIMAVAGWFTGELFINFSPAVLIPHMIGTPFYGFVRGFCIFFIWQHVLIAAGQFQLTKKKRSIFICLFVCLAQIYMNTPRMMFM